MLKETKVTKIVESTQETPMTIRFLPSLEIRKGGFSPRYFSKWISQQRTKPADSGGWLALKRDLWTLSNSHSFVFLASESLHSPLPSHFYSERNRKGAVSGQAEASAQTIWQPGHVWYRMLPLSLHSTEGKSQALAWELRCRQQQETPRMEFLNIYSIFNPSNTFQMSYGKLT